MACTIHEKMAFAWCLIMLLSAAANADGYYHSTNKLVSSTALSHPLTILQEHPYAVARSLTPTTLYIVPRGLLRVLDHNVANYFSEATPGVRVVLPTPLVVSAPTATISFPSEFTVDHEAGVRTPMNVGAVIAPVPTNAINYPITVRIVYAVATIEPHSFLPPAYAFPHYYYSYPRYTYHTALALPQRPYAADFPSVTSLATPSKPETAPSTAQEGEVLATPHKGGEPQLVTVLEFPTSVAEPGSLFFQPPLTGEELGNREPPQAVVPAGIVQSAAPIPNLSVFVNSKESPYLQVLREEAVKAKSPQRTTSFVIHGDTVQVDAL